MWRNPANRLDIETELDAHRLYVPAGAGKWWLARRNGKTRTWKRDATRFYIPIKYGFRNCAHIDETCALSYLRVAYDRQQAEGKETDHE